MHYNWNFANIKNIINKSFSFAFLFNDWIFKQWIKTETIIITNKCKKVIVYKT